MRLIEHIPAKAPRKHVMLGIGAGDGTIEFPCVSSLYSAAVLLWAADISVSLCIEAGNCHVDDMRNAIVSEFLTSDCDELVFIDEDVGFNASDLLKLVEYDRDVVGGVYPRKQFDVDFPVFVKPGTDLYADGDGLVEVHGLPTGFLKIKRGVLQKLWDREKKRRWVGSDEREYRPVFERGYYEGQRKSGDYAFCCKWREVGGMLFTDPKMRFSHTGKHSWHGSLGDFWLEKHGLLAQERASKLKWGVDELKAGNASKEVFEALCEGWNNQWSAPASLLEDVWNHADGDVLECGSGLTTMVLAAKGVCPTVLEHDPAFASHTTQMLNLFGLEADIVLTPLKDGWYDFDGGEYDLIIVDGPPRGMGERNIVSRRCKAKTWIIDDMGGEPRHRVSDTYLEHA